MDIQMMLFDCPAYLDSDGAQRCGLPAEVEYRYSASSTGGPVDSVKIRCPCGHGFNGPVELLTIKKDPGHGPVWARSAQRPAAAAPTTVGQPGEAANP
jgi:hypothetical protein